MALYQGSFSVFSTYVEVILEETKKLVSLMSILHVCGGDPKSVANMQNGQGYSPRMWR